MMDGDGEENMFAPEAIGIPMKWRLLTATRDRIITSVSHCQRPHCSVTKTQSTSVAVGFLQPRLSIDGDTLPPPRTAARAWTLAGYGRHWGAIHPTVALWRACKRACQSFSTGGTGT